MKLNILIAVLVGVLGYAGMYYFTHMRVPDGVRAASVPVPAVDVSGPAAVQSVDGGAVTDFDFTDRHGAARRLSDFAGQVIILNFWASWCAPCVVEFPDLLKAARRYPDDVAFVGVSSDFDAAKMERFLGQMDKAHGFSENVILTQDQGNRITQDLYGAYRIPVTLIISRDFQVVHKFIGDQWDYDVLEGVIQSHL